MLQQVVAACNVIRFHCPQLHRLPAKKFCRRSDISTQKPTLTAFLPPQMLASSGTRPQHLSAPPCHDARNRVARSRASRRDSPLITITANRALSASGVCPPSQPLKTDATSHPNGHTNGHASQRTNGHTNGSSDKGARDRINQRNDDDDNDQRPTKRRRTRGDTTPPPGLRKPKPESPPWRRIEAEGPTSFTQNGRRKSGRINNIPVEFQPRGNRRTKQPSAPCVTSSPHNQDSSLPATSKGAKNTWNKEKQPTSKSALSGPKALKKPSPESRSSSRSLRRRSHSPPPQPTRHSARRRQTSRLAQSPERIAAAAVSSTHHRHPPENDYKSPRIKLRVSRSGTIPLVHPDQVQKRPKIGTSFQDFWERAGCIPVEEGGLLASEDGAPYTDEMAVRDARLILRIEEELEPGGILSQQRCSLFAPEPEEEPPRQWARQDHMVKAMANFRKLLLAEQQRHRATAKKLAEACRDEWLRRQPKSAKEVEAEETEHWTNRYRTVVKAMTSTWENVRVEVNKRRLEQWEAEEQKRVKAALNEAVSLSEQKLQARRGGLDSELPSDDDGFSDLSDEMSITGSDNEHLLVDLDDDVGDEMGQDDDSDNMSTSDEEDEGDTSRDLGDENLTQEQLRAKYANLPDIDLSVDEQVHDASRNNDETAGETGLDTAADTSDESVNMDDDLGSSDIESNDENQDDGEDTSSESGEETTGLLGLLFGKAELRKMRTNASVSAHQQQESDIEMPNRDDVATASNRVNHNGDEEEEDDDKMSLVRHPDSCDDDAQSDSNMLEDTAQPDIGAEESNKMIDDDGLTRSDDAKIYTTVLKADQVKNQDLQMSTLSDSGPHDGGAVDQGAITDGVKQVAEKVRSTEMKPDTSTPSPARSQGSSMLGPKPLEADMLAPTDTKMARAETSRGSSAQPRSVHKTEIPFLLRGTLREYQHDGLDWLAGLYMNNTNGILADEMGLGKTIQTIALLAHLACFHEVWGPHLVVVPTSVMLNWEMEFKKWCPGFKILAYYGSQEERKRKRQGWNNDDVWNVCITSYQLVLQDQQVFKRRRWHYMILDEAHNIKNFKSQRWQTLLGFNTHSRLLLTGTPLQNNLTELWSLLFFLMPSENGVGGFADLQEFHDWFHKPESQILESGRDQMDEEAKAIISKLHKVLRPYLLRRLKADVEKQMPAKYEHVELCRLSKRQRELYDGFLSRSDTKETLASGNYMSIINCLMQLRKVCNHPDLFIDRPIMTSFRMQKSVAAGFEVTERRLRGSLLAEDGMASVNFGFLNLVPAEHEKLDTMHAETVSRLALGESLMRLGEVQKARAQETCSELNPSTIKSTLAHVEKAARWSRFEEVQHSLYLNSLRRQQRPIYGCNVVNLVNMAAHRRPCRPRPKVPHKIMAWFENDSTFVKAMMPTLDERADALKTAIDKFSCVTPAVVTRDLNPFLLGRRGIQAFTECDLELSAPVRWAPFLPKEAPIDPWQVARMRLSIQFPDKRLLQYDCGKLQVLDKLLRKLQSGGHRALIFTQMTKVLDVLERFLNIHGHKYLRLDGATKVEQRQIMTDRFNNDDRILCFILSTRSGGLGINLTGADTVIFYDQDWNPAMDKQCQDRCHRIGQTRDVHIYRLISEHTIEANILRKASQKQMLDDVVIQEGEFTTDYFNRLSVRDVLTENVDLTSEGVAAADAALDRVLGGPESSSKEQQTVGRALEQAEDREDVAAARVAEREIQADDADFTEKASGPATRQGTPSVKSALEANDDDETEYNAWNVRVHNIDDFMLTWMMEELKDSKLELPRDKKKSKKKKGKDTRKR
ncbi:hypothetical protein CDD81_5868 [Ophiocordyceps australis]|uniref:DNA helicase n=1 Tax=Ophiocordyceps australis TaxID=1399860 RepID=A0A2C5YGB1_9HYPO|nr:hypothetical protein CDD81_5868 [Ophiocordyceps australis]